MSWIGILLSFAVLENVLFVRQLGLPIERSPRLVAHGLAMSLLTAISALVAWLLRVRILASLGLAALQAPILVLLVAGIAAAVRWLIARAAPALGDPLGPTLRPSAIRSASLGVVLVVVRSGYGPGEALLAGLAAGLGYLLALSVLTAVARRLELEEVPSPLAGTPLALVSAGLVALAIAALDGALAVSIG